MFRITDENELRDCFRELDRSEIVLDSAMSFPLTAKDYLTWIEPSGARTYLVFQDGSFKAPFGIVFRRDQTLGPSVAAMCEWCHSVRSGNEVGILTAKARDNTRVGISLCRDLNCSAKIRSEPGAHDFPSTASVQERVRKLQEKMAGFVRRDLI
jgi:hypothetical protein